MFFVFELGESSSAFEKELVDHIIKFEENEGCNSR